MHLCCLTRRSGLQVLFTCDPSSTTAPRPQAAFAQERGPQLRKEEFFGARANDRNRKERRQIVTGLSGRIRDVTLEFESSETLQQCEKLFDVCDDEDDDDGRLEAHRYLKSVRETIKQCFDIQEPRVLEKYDSKVAELQQTEADFKVEKSKRSLLPSSASQVEEMRKELERAEERAEEQL